MRVLMVLVVMGLVIASIMGGPAQAATSFSVGPVALYFSFDASMTTRAAMKSVELIDSGTTPTRYEMTTEQYREFTPEEIAEGKRWADSSWVTIQPSTLNMVPGGKATINVSVNVPLEAIDAQYTTYVKITNGAETERVTLSIRVGAAVLEHKYSIYPSSYSLTASGPGDRESAELPITVNNVGGAPGRYVLTVRVPDKEEAGYTEGNPDWLQVTQPNVSLSPGQMGSVSMKMVLPVNVEDGKYALWAAVNDTSQESTIQVEYASKIFLTVDYQKSNWSGYWKVGAGIGGIVILGMVVGTAVVVKRRKRKPESLKW